MKKDILMMLVGISGLVCTVYAFYLGLSDEVDLQLQLSVSFAALLNTVIFFSRKN